jgi:hypothetical protein
VESFQAAKGQLIGKRWQGKGFAVGFAAGAQCKIKGWIGGKLALF